MRIKYDNRRVPFVDSDPYHGSYTPHTGVYELHFETVVGTFLTLSFTKEELKAAAPTLFEEPQK